MVSGTFHTMSQEWRYYSREKSLMQTLHVAQIPDSYIGSSVFITPTPPTGTDGSNFSAPKGNFPPITPYLGVNITQVVNNYPPYWLGNEQNASHFDTGTYGNWSGSFYFDVTTPHPIEGIDKGQWFMPPTGGTFLHTTFNQSSNGIGLPNGVDFTCTLSIANPLYPSSTGYPPPPNYTNAYYFWTQQGYLAGGGWGNFLEGNKFLIGWGNAAGMQISTIIDGVPLLAWLGNRQVTADSEFNWPTLTQLFHLG